jgi:hypothetical protein
VELHSHKKGAIRIEKWLLIGSNRQWHLPTILLYQIQDLKYANSKRLDNATIDRKNQEIRKIAQGSTGLFRFIGAVIKMSEKITIL